MGVPLVLTTVLLYFACNVEIIEVVLCHYYDKHKIFNMLYGDNLYTVVVYTAHYRTCTAGSRDFNSSVRVVRFNGGDSEISTCITLYDDQLHEGDEVFSVLLSVPSVTTLKPGLCVLATVTIVGMCVHMSVWLYVRS